MFWSHSVRTRSVMTTASPGRMGREGGEQPAGRLVALDAPGNAGVSQSRHWTTSRMSQVSRQMTGFGSAKSWATTVGDRGHYSRRSSSYALRRRRPESIRGSTSRADWLRSPHPQACVQPIRIDHRTIEVGLPDEAGPRCKSSS